MNSPSFNATPFRIFSGVVLIVIVISAAIEIAISDPTKYQLIRKIVSTQVGIETVFPVGDRSTVWPDFPSLHGRIRAAHDLERGEAKFYIYGLISHVSGKRMSDVLHKYQLTAEFGGCLTGTPGHQADMAYNNMIEKVLNISVSGM